jgi:hypothetical protein
MPLIHSSDRYGSRTAHGGQPVNGAPTIIC